MASGPTDDEPKQGAGPSDDNMGALIGLIGLVLLFFAIFFFLGFKEAKKQQRQPGAIARFVILHTRLVHIGDTNHLVYGNAEWMLDLKANKVKLGDPVGQQQAMLGSAIPKDSSLLQNFFGTAPAALTLQELVTILKKGGDYRKIIAQIIAQMVGAGTGFFTGRWVANSFFPLKHDDPAIMKWLSSSRDHSEIKKLFLIELIKNRKEIAKKSAQQTIDSDSAEKLRAYEVVENSLGNPEYVPSNEDFSVFAEGR